MADGELLVNACDFAYWTIIIGDVDEDDTYVYLATCPIVPSVATFNASRDSIPAFAVGRFTSLIYVTSLTMTKQDIADTLNFARKGVERNPADTIMYNSGYESWKRKYSNYTVAANAPLLRPKDPYEKLSYYQGMLIGGAVTIGIGALFPLLILAIGLLALVVHLPIFLVDWLGYFLFCVPVTIFNCVPIDVPTADQTPRPAPVEPPKPLTGDEENVDVVPQQSHPASSSRD